MTRLKTSPAPPKKTTSKVASPSGPPPIDRLTVRNYQAIAEGDIKLGGLTVIVGANDAGKTALQRALVALGFNQVGRDYIRWGQDEVSVSVEIGQQRITWQKGDSASYTIEDVGTPATGGRLFSKLGAAVPEAIEDLLGFRTIEIDPTTRLRPQFRMMHDQPFLLDETATKAARALAKNSRLGILVTALAAQKKLLKAIEKKRDTDLAQRERLDERLETFPDVAGLATQAVAARETLGRIDAVIVGIKTAQGYLLAKGRAVTLQSLVKRLPDVDGLVARIDVLLPAVERLERAVGGQQAASQALSQAEADAEEADAALREFADTIDVCPVCGKPVTAEEILDHDD